MALSVENLVETRPVGEQERIFHYLHMLGGLVASGAMQVRGPLTPELQKQRDEYVFQKTGRRPAPPRTGSQP